MIKWKFYRVSPERDKEIASLTVKRILETNKPCSKQKIHDELVSIGLASQVVKKSK